MTNIRYGLELLFIKVHPKEKCLPGFHDGKSLRQEHHMVGHGQSQSKSQIAIPAPRKIPNPRSQITILGLGVLLGWGASWGRPGLLGGQQLLTEELTLSSNDLAKTWINCLFCSYCTKYMIDIFLLLFSISPVWLVVEDSDKGPAEEYSENTAKNTTELFLFLKIWKLV